MRTEFQAYPGHSITRFMDRKRSHPYAIQAEEIPGINGEVLLTWRSFREIDEMFGSRISTSIDDMILFESGRVSILDIGGGWEAVTAKQIARKYGTRVAVTNVDVLLLTDKRRYGMVNPVLGEATELPIPDESQDIVYSSYTFGYFPQEMLYRALSEVVRVLKPGRSAHVFQNGYRYIDPNGDEAASLSRQLGVDLEFKGSVIHLSKPLRQAA